MKLVFLLYYACEFFTFFSFFVNYDKFSETFAKNRDFPYSNADKSRLQTEFHCFFYPFMVN